MDRRKQEALDWLAARVVVANANGGMMQTGAIYEALEAAFPDKPLTPNEVRATLVQAAERGVVAVEFADKASG